MSAQTIKADLHLHTYSFPPQTHTHIDILEDRQPVRNVASAVSVLGWGEGGVLD